MAKINEVLISVLEKIRPGRENLQELEKSAKNFVSLLKSHKLNAFIGGSLAKGTLVKSFGKKQDIDIFVVFENEAETRELESFLKKIRLPGELKSVHGSRDYFQVQTEKVIFEIVPVVKNIDEGLVQNVTDFSLSHVDYVRKLISKNKKLADEIILAKTFCKAQGVYGAEGYVKGFSGYSLEVLVSHFGSFLYFLKGIAKKKVIDTKKYFKNEKEAFREINSSKLVSPILVVDPTYKFRNISAGLSYETFEKFLKVAKEFLKKPGLEFFEKKKFGVDEFRKMAKGSLVELKMSTDRQEGDIAGTKMKKFFDFVINQFERYEQRVLKNEFVYSGEGHTAHGYLIIKEKKEIDVKGPPIKMKEACEKFKKGKRTFKKGRFLWAKKKISVEGILSEVKEKMKEMGVNI